MEFQFSEKLPIRHTIQCMATAIHPSIHFQFAREQWDRHWEQNKDAPN
jgi:hypothetical protein